MPPPSRRFVRTDRSMPPKLVAYCQYLTTAGRLRRCRADRDDGRGKLDFVSARKWNWPGPSPRQASIPNRAIFGTGACATQDAIDLSKAALDAGFPNVLVLPPFYYKNPSDEGLYRYFAQLIEAVGDDRLRVYLYHFPQMSMTPIPVDVAVRLKKEFGAVVAGLKDSSGDMSQALAFADATGGVDGDFDVYPSSEAFYFRRLEAGGCAGIISGSTNAFANYTQKPRYPMGRTARPSNWSRTPARWRRSTRLMAAMKQMEAWRTGDDTWTRMAPPLVPLSADQQSQPEGGRRRAERPDCQPE